MIHSYISPSMHTSLKWPRLLCACYMPYPTHSPLGSPLQYLGLQVNNPSLCHFLQSPVTFSLLVPNIHYTAYSFSTLSPCSSLNITNEVPRQN